MLLPPRKESGLDFDQFHPQCGCVIVALMTSTCEETTELTRAERKDLEILARFIAIWCQAQHDPALAAPIAADPACAPLSGCDCRLCPACRELLAYALARRLKCPLDPKPACKDCPIHCYRPERRAEIRKVMAFSGKRLILRGRLDLLWHYFF